MILNLRTSLKTLQASDAESFLQGFKSFFPDAALGWYHVDFITKEGSTKAVDNMKADVLKTKVPSGKTEANLGTITVNGTEAVTLMIGGSETSGYLHEENFPKEKAMGIRNAVPKATESMLKARLGISSSGNTVGILGLAFAVIYVAVFFIGGAMIILYSIGQSTLGVVIGLVAMIYGLYAVYSVLRPKRVVRPL